MSIHYNPTNKPNPVYKPKPKPKPKAKPKPNPHTKTCGLAGILGIYLAAGLFLTEPDYGEQAHVAVEMDEATNPDPNPNPKTAKCTSNPNPKSWPHSCPDCCAL